MKKNVASLVLAGVDKKVLANAIISYLPEQALDKLIYHLSGDDKLCLELPAYNEDKVVEALSTDGRFNISNVNVRLDAFEQQIEVSFYYDKHKYYATEEEASEGGWGGDWSKSDKYPFKGIYHTCTTIRYSALDFIQKFEA